MGRWMPTALVTVVAAVGAVACGSTESVTVGDETAATTGAAATPAATDSPAITSAEEAEGTVGDTDISAAIEQLSNTVGGLSAASRACVEDVLRDDPATVAAALDTSGEAAMTPGTLEVISCMTPDEAAALMPPEDGPGIDPNEIGCLMAELEGVPDGERILDVLSGADPSGQGLTPSQSAQLGEAVEACGIETGFGFSDAEGEFDDVEDSQDLGGSWGPCGVGLLLYPGDECSYTTFTLTIRSDGAAVIDGSVGGSTMSNAVMEGESIDLGQFRATRNGTVWEIKSLP